ncbi:MAG TPA: M48 family metallopeptidase [Terriglobia bacterium]|nr:M48 family metallopeptidase [Terriglobia bacterium]
MKRLRAWIGLAMVVVFAAVPLAADGQKDDVDAIGSRKIAHRSIISEQKEIGIGKQYSEQVDRQSKLVTDPVVTEYVNRVAQNIARNSDLKIPLTVKVIDDPSINAFALPGGFLYVNTGVIQHADEESQLAGVMAHEIGHVAARHWASMMTKQTILQFAMIPLMFTPMSIGVYYGLSAAMQGLPIIFLKFTQQQEAEADFLGLEYMYKAGYDPESYVTFFGKVAEMERHQPGSVPSIFMDHPPTPDRIINCEKEIKSILPKKPEYLVSTSEFNDVKARMTTVLMAQNRQKPGGPTLEKRKGKTTTTGGTPTDDGSDQPPVLKRRDGSDQ